MNIFKSISKLIERLNPFGKQKAIKKVSVEKDVPFEIRKTEKSQESEKETIAFKEGDSSPEIVENLAPKQKKLMQPKLRVLDKSVSDEKVHLI